MDSITNFSSYSLIHPIFSVQVRDRIKIMIMKFGHLGKTAIRINLVKKRFLNMYKASKLGLRNLTSPTNFIS